MAKKKSKVAPKPFVRLEQLIPRQMETFQRQMEEIADLLRLDRGNFVRREPSGTVEAEL